MSRLPCRPGSSGAAAVQSRKNAELSPKKCGGIPGEKRGEGITRRKRPPQKIGLLSGGEVPGRREEKPGRVRALLSPKGLVFAGVGRPGRLVAGPGEGGWAVGGLQTP